MNEPTAPNPKTGRKRGPRTKDLQETQDRALHRIAQVIRSGQDPLQYRSLEALLCGPRSRVKGPYVEEPLDHSTVYRKKKPVGEGGFGWTMEGLVDQTLADRPYLRPTLDGIRAAAGPDMDALEKVHRLVRFPESTGAPAEQDLTRFLTSMSDLATALPIRMLRSDRYFDYCEAAIRRVRYEARAKPDVADRDWQEAARIGEQLLMGIEPLVDLADAAWALQARQTRQAWDDFGAPKGFPGYSELRRRLVSPREVSAQDLEAAEDLEGVPGDSIDDLLTGYYLLLGEVVYARVREERLKGWGESAQKVLAQLLNDPARRVPDQLDYLSSLVGTAAIAELDARPTEDDRGENLGGLDRALKTLGRVESAGSTFWPIQDLDRPSSWDETTLRLAYIREASRLWLAIDAYPDLRAKGLTKRLGVDITKQLGMDVEGGSPLAHHPNPSGIAACYAEATGLALRIRRARASEDRDDPRDWLLEVIRTKVEQATDDQPTLRINQLDMVPFHVLDEELWGTGSPLDLVDERVKRGSGSTDSASARSADDQGDPDGGVLGKEADPGAAQDWFEAVVALRWSQAFDLIPPMQRDALWTQVLKPRGLERASSEWRTMLDEETHYTRIPLQHAISELTAMVGDLRRAMETGATLLSDNHTALLRASRELLDLQLWMGTTPTRPIKPRAPADGSDATWVYWQLLLGEMARLHGVTIDRTRDGYLVIEGGSEAWEDVRLAPLRHSGVVWMRRAGVASQETDQFIPLMGLQPVQLLDAMEKLGDAPAARVANDLTATPSEPQP